MKYLLSILCLFVLSCDSGDNNSVSIEDLEGEWMLVDHCHSCPTPCSYVMDGISFNCEEDHCDYIDERSEFINFLNNGVGEEIYHISRSILLIHIGM